MFRLKSACIFLRTDKMSVKKKLGGAEIMMFYFMYYLKITDVFHFL